MERCWKCGQNILDYVSICPHCGGRQAKRQPLAQPTPRSVPSETEEEVMPTPPKAEHSREPGSVERLGRAEGRSRAQSRRRRGRSPPGGARGHG